MTKELYWRRRNAGLCVRCGKPVDDGRHCCESCLGYNRAYAGERYRKLEAAHRCGHCGRQLPEGWYYVLCELCKGKQETRKDRPRRQIDGQTD